MTFAGSPDHVEARLVPEAGYEFDGFHVSGLPRRAPVAFARGVLRAGSAVRACRRILASRRPDVVLGGGGYVSGPMVAAAGTSRIPAALMEADAELGLANRLAAPFARRVFLAFPIAGDEGGKYRVTGRPIPRRSRTVNRVEARAEFELPADGPVVLVFGGSQGARALNELAVDSFGASGPPVLHLCGERDYDALRDRVSRTDYRLVAFTDRFGAALSAVDLAVARAGGSVWELAAAGLPSILVPYPHATAAHQAKNAAYFERAGGAIVIAETELERVPRCVKELVEDTPRRTRMCEAMLRVARPDAAGEIAEELIALARA